MAAGETIRLKDSETMVAFIRTVAENARAAALRLAAVETEKKNAVLETLAGYLEDHSEAILLENEKDLEGGVANGLSQPLLERLTLTPERIAAMAEGTREVAALPDPVGEEMERILRPNGLDIRKVRVPLGVIGIIYESRPNVTIDCAALCLKSGNACILRGGKEAFHTNSALAALGREALGAHEADENAIQFIATTDRHALRALLQCEDSVNCIIPRGGEGLIRFVAKNSTIPVIKHYKGVCCLYLDRTLNPDLAEKIVLNAKTQRPGVCNAAENLFVHHAIAPEVLPRIAKALAAKGVELRVDEAARKILEKEEGMEMVPAEEGDYYEEYLDLIIALKVVASLEDGIAAVNRYGSRHSDAIVTTDKKAAEKFMREVDSATVYWNASTRFTDGFEFGLGAEIGISTDKLHARGPMGLRELTTYKYLIYGQGQLK